MVSQSQILYLFIHLFILFPRHRLGCRFQAGSPPLPEMKALKDHIYISDIQRELLRVDRIIETSVENYPVHGDNTTTAVKEPPRIEFIFTGYCVGLNLMVLHCVCTI